MNDLIRPALYGAWHDVQHGAGIRAGRLFTTLSAPSAKVRDFLAKGRRLAAVEGDLLAVLPPAPTGCP